MPESLTLHEAKEVWVLTIWFWTPFHISEEDILIKSSSSSFITPNSWIILKEPTPDAGKGEDDISGAAFILAKYILDTGDIDGVMEFLQGMVRAGKVSSDQCSYQSFSPY